MLFSETLEKLKNNLPSQYKDNIIDYKTLKNDFHEVVESLNKTGIYDLQCHSHLIMENGMKTNIDNHIREIFKKNKVVKEGNTLVEIFDDENIISSYNEVNTNIDIKNEKNLKLKEEEEGNDTIKYKDQIPHDDSSITSVYEKDFYYNFKDNLEKELKKSQVKLVKFINHVKNKEEIINGLSLKYYQIFYALKEIEKDDGTKQLQSNLIITVSKVDPQDIDVQKLLDEITSQNTELFEHDENANTNENENDNRNENDNTKIEDITISFDNDDDSDEIKKEKINTEHLKQLKESLKIKKTSNNSLEDIAAVPLDEIINNKAFKVESHQDSSHDMNQTDIEGLRLMQSPVDIKFNEHMLGKTHCDDSNEILERKNSSYTSQYSSSSLNTEENEEYDCNEIFDDDGKLINI